jgi:hypothetical protein
MKTKLLKKFAILSLGLMGLFLIINNVSYGAQELEGHFVPPASNNKKPQSSGPHTTCCIEGTDYCSLSNCSKN